MSASALPPPMDRDNYRIASLNKVNKHMQGPIQMRTKCSALFPSLLTLLYISCALCVQVFFSCRWFRCHDSPVLILNPNLYTITISWVTKPKSHLSQQIIYNHVQNTWIITSTYLLSFNYINNTINIYKLNYENDIKSNHTRYY